MFYQVPALWPYLYLFSPDFAVCTILPTNCQTWEKEGTHPTWLVALSLVQSHHAVDRISASAKGNNHPDAYLCWGQRLESPTDLRAGSEVDVLGSPPSAKMFTC